MCILNEFIERDDIDAMNMAQKWDPLSPLGKSSELLQYAMLKACDACADMGQL